MKKLIVRAQVEGKQLERAVKKALMSKSGESFIDSAVKILMSVVIGALLLGGLYALFKNNILPTLSERINEMFNFKG